MSNNVDSVERAVGRLEGQIQQVLANQKTFDEKLDEISSTIDHTKGAVSGAKWFAGLIATAFGGVGTLLGAWLSSIRVPH